MAVRKNSSEEDYLDNLLNAVLNDTNEKKQEELNNEEDLLGEIEDDLFDGDISAMEALGFEEVLNDETIEEKPKKEKKGLWGRKKKEKKRTEKDIKQDAAFKETGQDVVFEEAEDFGNSPEFMEDILSDTLLGEDTLTDNGQQETEVLVGENNSFEEEDMQGLYDILGVNDTEENQDIDEITRLEEEKPKKKSKKKDKDKKPKKKPGLGKKNKDKEPDDDDISDIGFDFGMDLSDDKTLSDEGTDEDLSGEGFALNSGMEEMGLGGFEDIFMGGEETESHSDSSEDIGMMDAYDSGLMSDGEEEESEEPKEKKKKEKKEKKKKEKKPKKEKIKKEKKPKKPKPPKEPDQIIKIPIPLVVFFASLIILLVIGLKLGGNYRYYMEKTDLALEYYLDKDFDAAYNELRGLDLNEKDVNFYNQVETIMYVQRHYTSYKNLYSLKMYDQALFTLLRGIKMYDKYKDTAREYNCYDDMALVLSWITTALQEKYGLTESEARELNLLTDRYVYAEKIYKLADEAEEREEKEQAEKENAAN